MAFFPATLEDLPSFFSEVGMALALDFDDVGVALDFEVTLLFFG